MPITVVLVQHSLKTHMNSQITLAAKETRVRVRKPHSQSQQGWASLLVSTEMLKVRIKPTSSTPVTQHLPSSCQSVFHFASSVLYRLRLGAWWLLSSSLDALWIMPLASIHPSIHAASQVLTSLFQTPTRPSLCGEQLAGGAHSGPLFGKNSVMHWRWMSPRLCHFYIILYLSFGRVVSALFSVMSAAGALVQPKLTDFWLWVRRFGPGRHSRGSENNYFGTLLSFISSSCTHYWACGFESASTSAAICAPALLSNTEAPAGTDEGFGFQAGGRR